MTTDNDGDSIDDRDEAYESSVLLLHGTLSRYLLAITSNSSADVFLWTINFSAEKYRIIQRTMKFLTFPARSVRASY